MFARVTAAVLVLAGCAPSPAAQSVISINMDALVTPQQWASACPEYGREQWDKAAPPYRLYGNSFQVGTCGLSSVLIVGSEGAMLIDPLTEGGAPHVLANIEALGLAPSDVKYLVLSHEHFDHAAGAAYIVAQTGAQLLAGPEAMAVMESGKVDPADPQASWLPDMPPVKVARALAAEESIDLGSVSVKGFATPGHTAGAYSWSWRECEGGPASVNCKRLAFADSLSPAKADDYRFADHPEWVARHRVGIARLESEPCDLLVTGHPDASGMVANAKAGIAGGKMDCAGYARNRRQRLDKMLADEAEAG